jgi:protein-disulfide isomerase
MANDRSEKASPQDRQGEPLWKTSERIPLGILIGVVVLIALAGLNVYETREQRTEMNDRMTQLAAAINSRPAANPAPARPSGPDPEKVYTVKTEGAPFEGSKSAPVQIVEISDFQCPFCSKVGPTLKQIQDVYKDKVAIVWKHLPLTSIHQYAIGAAVASEAAHNQGKFWEYHDKLFANQAKLSPDDLKQYARDLGLDTAKFDADMVNPATRQRVTADSSEVNSLGITGTPAFFVNGHYLSGAQPFDGFARVINAELQRLKLPVPPTPVPTPVKPVPTPVK